MKANVHDRALRRKQKFYRIDCAKSKKFLEYKAVVLNLFVIEY